MQSNKLLSKYTIVLLLIFIMVWQLIPMIYRVKGISMEPQFKNNDYVVIDYYHRHKSYQNGDVVIIKKDHGNRPILKRVIGIAGDHVQIIDNELYINGNKQIETYVLDKMNTYDLDFVVPKDQLFVLGDNRNSSVDSRHFGLVNVTNVLGKVILHI